MFHVVSTCFRPNIQQFLRASRMWLKGPFSNPQRNHHPMAKTASFIPPNSSPFSPFSPPRLSAAPTWCRPRCAALCRFGQRCSPGRPGHHSSRGWVKYIYMYVYYLNIYIYTYINIYIYIYIHIFCRHRCRFRCKHRDVDMERGIDMI